MQHYTDSLHLQDGERPERPHRRAGAGAVHQGLRLRLQGRHLLPRRLPGGRALAHRGEAEGAGLRRPRAARPPAGGSRPGRRSPATPRPRRCSSASPSAGTPEPGQHLKPRPRAAEGITYRMPTPLGTMFTTVTRNGGRATLRGLPPGGQGRVGHGRRDRGPRPADLPRPAPALPLSGGRAPAGGGRPALRDRRRAPAGLRAQPRALPAGRHRPGAGGVRRGTQVVNGRPRASPRPRRRRAAAQPAAAEPARDPAGAPSRPTSAPSAATPPWSSRKGARSATAAVSQLRLSASGAERRRQGGPAGQESEAGPRE